MQVAICEGNQIFRHRTDPIPAPLCTSQAILPSYSSNGKSDASPRLVLLIHTSVKRQAGGVLLCQWLSSISNSSGGRGSIGWSIVRSSCAFLVARTVKGWRSWPNINTHTQATGSAGFACLRPPVQWFSYRGCLTACVWHLVSDSESPITFSIGIADVLKAVGHTKADAIVTLWLEVVLAEI